MRFAGARAALLGVLALARPPNSHASEIADASSPLGVWQTMDDKSGQPRALVRIYLKDGNYFGRIENTFTASPDTRVCVPCKDERKNRPIIGLLVLRNMTAHGNEFEGGDILDPESGAVYRCKFHLQKGGSELVMRGFIGISLLGRTQTWRRRE